MTDIAGSEHKLSADRLISIELRQFVQYVDAFVAEGMDFANDIAELSTMPVVHRFLPDGTAVSGHKYVDSLAKINADKMAAADQTTALATDLDIHDYMEKCKTARSAGFRDSRARSRSLSPNIASSSYDCERQNKISDEEFTAQHALFEQASSPSPEPLVPRKRQGVDVSPMDASVRPRSASTRSPSPNVASSSYDHERQNTTTFEEENAAQHALIEQSSSPSPEPLVPPKTHCIDLTQSDDDDSDDSGSSEDSGDDDDESDKVIPGSCSRKRILESPAPGDFLTPPPDSEEGAQDDGVGPCANNTDEDESDDDCWTDG